MEDNSDITIEGSLATWKMAPISGELGGTYEGTFIFRCYLTPLQLLQAGRQYREYLGTHAGMATDTESGIAFSLAQLSQRIYRAPPFWSASVAESGIAGDIKDLNVLTAILDGSIRAENLFKDRIAKERDALLNKTIAAGEALLQKDSK